MRKLTCLLSTIVLLSWGVMYSPSEAAPEKSFDRNVERRQTEKSSKVIAARTLKEGLTNVGSIILDEKDNLGFIVTDDGEPQFFQDDQVLENMDVTYDDQTVSIVGGSLDADDQLMPTTQANISLTVTGNLTVEVTSADGEFRRFNIRVTEQFKMVAAEVCNCYGGATIPKRACLATECADPAECATGPQPSQAHCKYMEQGIVRYAH